MGLADKIKSMTTTKAAIIGVIIAGVYYLLAFDSGEERKNTIAIIDKELTSLNQETTKLEKTSVDAQRFVDLARELGASINKIVKYIPEELTDAEIVKNLSVSARSVGAKIIGIKSRSRSVKQQHDFYDELPVVVELIGTYGQIMAFLSQLTQVERIYTVKNMSFALQRREERSDIKFTTTVVGYKYKGNNEDEGEKE